MVSSTYGGQELVHKDGEATWFGFHLAKDITLPIKELAEATHRIAPGDLNFRILMKAADEIGMLVAA
jgi:two-component system, NtrC family, nitrogen regulation sensor histidine kinase NtrY